LHILHKHDTHTHEELRSHILNN